MKRLLWVWLCLLVLAPAALAQTDELVVWHRYDLSDDSSPNAVNLREFIADFEAETGITVRYEQVAWDQLPVKLSVAVQSGGDVPDITAMSSQHIPALRDIDGIVALEELLAGAAWVDDLSRSDTDVCIIEGARVCVMVHVRGGITYYRAEAFPDGFPQTRADWLRVAPELVASTDYEALSTMYLGRSYSAVETQWYPMVLANGGRLFDDAGRPAWASVEVAEVVEFLRVLLAEEALPEIGVVGDFQDAEAPWLAGEAASFRGASWSPIFVPDLREQVDSGAVLLEGGIDFGDGARTLLIGDGWVIPAGAANPDGAALWLERFMQPDFLATWAVSQNGIPTLPEAATDAAFDTPFFTAVAEILDAQGVYMQDSPYYVESMDVLAATLQELLIDPERDALAALTRAQDEVLRRYW